MFIERYAVCFVVITAAVSAAASAVVANGVTMTINVMIFAGIMLQSHRIANAFGGMEEDTNCRVCGYYFFLLSAPLIPNPTTERMYTFCQ